MLMKIKKPNSYIYLYIWFLYTYIFIHDNKKVAINSAWNRKVKTKDQWSLKWFCERFEWDLSCCQIIYVTTVRIPFFHSIFHPNHVLRGHKESITKACLKITGLLGLKEETTHLIWSEPDIEREKTWFFMHSSNLKFLLDSSSWFQR